MRTSTITALLRLGSLASDHWERGLQEILRVASDVLEVERVNYWRLREQPRSILCELGYLAEGQTFERGFVLRERDARPYFEEIQKHQVLAVEDAWSDSRTRALAPYLEARHVASLLDTPIRVGGRIVGILCAEHVGTPRRWTEHEAEFALASGHVISAMLEARARNRAEDCEKRAAVLADVTAALAEKFDSGDAPRVALERALPTLGEMATLTVFDGETLRNVARVHVNEAGLAILDELLQRFPPGPRGVDLASHTIRERQSLLVPYVSAEAARAYGMMDDPAYFAMVESLEVCSAMAVPIQVRGQLTGAMVFATTTRTYDQEDLHFAEVYAQRIGVALDNERLYRQAQKAIVARDEFLSLAAHELRTPLASLQLSAHSLARKASETAPVALASLSERILRQTDRLRRLVERLLDTCHIGSERPSLDLASVDLVTIVGDVVHSFQEIAKRAGAEIVFSPGPSVVGQFDAVRIEQVVWNLLDNAVKFGQKKPIEVSVRMQDATAAVSVRDMGPGIPPGDQERVFERYGRSPSAQGIGGLGLGLHLAREIVGAHGGTIHLESAPGGGSDFTVELPLVPPPPQDR